MLLPFKGWHPDLPDLNNPGSPVATNVIPSAVGFRPFKRLVPISTALDNRCVGAGDTKDKDGNVRNFAGDAGKLYEIIDGVATDRSQTSITYSVDDGEFWEFAQWKQKVIACGWDGSHTVSASASPYPQVRTLGGTTFSDLQTDFEAKHMAVIREFVVFGNTYDSGDGEVPNRVRWSAQGDETDYTASAATQSGADDLLRGGAVQKILGGEFGIIICESSVWRMTYAGPPTIWQFDEIDAGIGTHAPQSCVRHNNVVYFLADDGFRATSGEASQRIGAERVDKEILAELDPPARKYVVAAADPINDLVMWIVPSNAATYTRPDTVYIYNPATGDWSRAETEIDYIFQSGTSAYTLEALTAFTTSIDDLPETLDSRLYTGGEIRYGAYGSDKKLSYFVGTPLEGEVETQEILAAEGKRAMVTGARSLVNGGTVTLSLGTRDSQGDDVVFHGDQIRQDSGYHRFRKSGKFIRFKAKMTGDWTHALGVADIEVRPLGRR
jgi:hypothetical protein